MQFDACMHGMPCSVQIIISRRPRNKKQIKLNALKIRESREKADMRTHGIMDVTRQQQAVGSSVCWLL